MNNKDRLVMGKDCAYAMDENHVNNNVLIVGGTGSGKTHYVLEPMLLHTEDSSVVVNINKRILFDRYAPLFEQKGYKVLDLNLAHPEQGNIAFDFLPYLKSDKDIRDFAKNLVEAALGKIEAQKDAYWNVAAGNLLAFLIRFTKDYWKNPDFRHVMYTMQKLSKALDVLFADTEASTEEEKKSMEFLETMDKYAAKRCSMSATNGYNTARYNARNTSMCILSTLSSAIDAVFSEELLRLPAKAVPMLDIRCLGQEKTILFITVPPLNQTTHVFSNILFAQIFKTLFEFAEDECYDGELPVPVRLMFDDFACGGIIPDFDKTISIIRQKKISATLLLQDFSQLNSMYSDKKAQTIANNCDSWIYMGGMDETSVSKVSRLSNMAFEDVYYMPVNQVIVIRRGNPEAIITSRYEIEQDYIYQNMLELSKKDKAGFERVAFAS